ncbi:MAG: JAB domain-containing protein [Euryarchaeota archaeon]|nr:JAB domain-containing protein [Euryarchaeota archaeon]
MAEYGAKLRELPVHERPRERLMELGAGALSDAELLAILLRTGTKEESVLALAQRLLRRYSLSELARASVAELKKIRGISDAKACEIAACFELARRLEAGRGAERRVVRSSDDAYRLLYPRLAQKRVEVFAGIYLNSKNRVLRVVNISSGGMEASVVQPREVFRIALEEGASRVIVGHNHPSGDPEPSQDDLRITAALFRAGELLGVELLDHLVVGDGCYVSLRDRGRLRG